MSLSTTEEKRLRDAEVIVTKASYMIKGAASKNQLNRLLVLAQEEIRKLNNRVTSLETKVETLLGLARKLQ